MSDESWKTDDAMLEINNLSGDDHETCRRIESMLKQLSLGVVMQVSIDALPGIEPIGSCRL